ncbi:MAG: Methionine aminopeptidase [Alphaproteobacteria bacterium MarineAlpha5_Bin6]|nr:MAG: Methionine aminopeptidase [Alphaproteobacteria bacterium MarineAlpha5_Bin7]PPR54001.1 MAG: Methionine aminopeptidase [Alphaproteobacteria bacterium MarineAlpha5_Bin6]|tara:strand:- start:2878 stop:3672 length:795 start_codon:yes stop_codon:yes gene_type:complete
MNTENIYIHNVNDFVAMRKAGSLTAKILDALKNFIEPGISTEDINEFCHRMIIKNDAVPAPLNYKNFPKSVCTSVNHVVCHGIPSEKKILKNGDIINVDVTVILDGWHGDSSRTFAVGNINNKILSLLKTTYECLLIGIENAKPGKKIGDIGYSIQKYAEAKNFSVVRDFCGHGIGKKFHTPPSILHYGSIGEGVEIVPGMFFTIEPMINIGNWQVKILNDGWTAVTKDKSLSAQYEHTIGITENGNEIFTLSQNNSDFPINTI